MHIRGYKICDRHTGLGSTFHRDCSNYSKDGLRPIPPCDDDIYMEAAEVTTTLVAMMTRVDKETNQVVVHAIGSPQ